MFELFLEGLLLTLSLMIILWLISVVIKNVSIVDVFWGLGFVIINFYYFLATENIYLRKFILLFLVTLWGLRLTIYLAWRNIGKGEDFRYKEFRKKYGPERYWWFSFFQVFLLQGSLIMIVSLPLLGTNFETTNNSLNVLDYFALMIWLIGFIFETGGDYQLSKFKKDPNNRGKLLKTGFWKYTRHPNYFGDSAVWWSYAIFSIAAGSYWTFIGAIIMTALIIKVSGVALLEKSLKNKNPDYLEYIEKTSPFLPRSPKP